MNKQWWYYSFRLNIITEGWLFSFVMKIKCDFFSKANVNPLQEVQSSVTLLEWDKNNSWVNVKKYIPTTSKIDVFNKANTS